jgi:1-deoxy-D-xylulose-5-phosphate reductoisomerase
LDDVREAVESEGVNGVEYVVGPTALDEIASRQVDVVLNGLCGSLGLNPTLAALDAGNGLALANKESLVVGGTLVLQHVQREGQIVPVDSEHSAIAQALRSGTHGEVDHLVLTASGGPFRGWCRGQLADVTPEQALAHPTWNMGPVVTVNSATLMNKALELIEAHLLFGIEPDRIDVVVHPQSIVHSMVTFHDGATIAQASYPDMRLPIALGLSWPERLESVIPPLNFDAATSWDFEPLDSQVFPAIDLARSALGASPAHPVALNAANEVCVDGFLARNMSFTGIVDVVARVVSELPNSSEVTTVHDIVEIDSWARRRARELGGLS